MNFPVIEGTAVPERTQLYVRTCGPERQGKARKDLRPTTLMALLR